MLAPDQGTSSGAIPGPIVVDLDGTLIRTDLLFESANQCVAQDPVRALLWPFWLAKGRAHFKARLAESYVCDPSALRYNNQLLDWLREQKAVGRRLVLATASHELLVHPIARHLALFDEVLASDGESNLKADAKREALTARYGVGRFDYVGNSFADLSIWGAANQAFVVSQSRRLIGQVRALGKLNRVFNGKFAAPAASLVRAMRPHQWIKNLLVFVPLLAAHRVTDRQAVANALMVFFAFSLTASSVYVLNDLVDVDHDRRHKTKRHRPFASGDLSLLAGWIAWPLMLAVALGIAAAALPRATVGVLGLYGMLTLAYSFRLKQIAVVDVLLLAGLYTLRIIAGAAATYIQPTFWLLAFAMFLFLSLAFAKRYGELRVARQDSHSGQLHGRGYSPSDLEAVSAMGTASGFIAVLVLALYVQDAHTAVLYRTPEYIWLVCPLLLFWIARTWLIAHRGEMHDDPILFAIKDKVSLGVVLLAVCCFTLAALAAT